MSRWQAESDYQRHASDTNQHSKARSKKKLYKSLLIGVLILLFVGLVSVVIVEKLNHF